MRLFWAILLFIFTLPTSPLKAASFAEELYLEGDYYRAVTESKRLGFARDQNINLQMIQAKAHFQLNEYGKSRDLTLSILKKEPKDIEANQLLGLNLIRLKDLKKAEEHFAQVNPEKTWPIVSQKNPNLSKNISYFVPGSGLLYTGSPWKALGSFILNGIFIKATSDSLQAGNNASALVFFTFEMGWYFGGANAAFEDAENYNYRSLKELELGLFKVNF